MLPRVVVLMSTFNGEKFLREQLDSVLRQINVEIKINIRDDGSSDGTQNILEEYSKNNHNISFKVGKNIGAAQSFLTLLYQIDWSKSYDYLAFCDQDDLWDEKKINMAVEKIKRVSTPALYYSALNTFNNITLEKEKINVPYQYTLIESMFKSVFPGCTMVINRAGIEMLYQIGKPSAVVMHDCFIYQVFIAAGYSIFYDTNSYINYRIHGSNYSILKKNISSWYKHMRKIAYDQKGLRLEAAKELYRLSHQFATEKAIEIFRNFAEYNCNFKKKRMVLRYLKDTRFSRMIKVEFLVAFLFDIY